MCHSKLGKQKWPFRSRLEDASCSECHALFLVSPVSRSSGWSIRTVHNWQERETKGGNKTKHHNSNFTLRAQSLALRCGYQTAAVCLFVFFVWPGRVTWRDINLHFSSCSDVCSQPLNLPYIPTACYMSERLLKVCHNDDDLFISPFPLHISRFSPGSWWCRKSGGLLGFYCVSVLGIRGYENTRIWGHEDTRVWEPQDMRTQAYFRFILADFHLTADGVGNQADC